MLIDSGNGYGIVVVANSRCGYKYWVRIEAVAIGIEYGIAVLYNCICWVQVHLVL